MASTWFIADLHLDADHVGELKVLEHFLRNRLAQDDHLYILGDLFDYWIGDDDPAPWFQAIRDALRECAAAGTRIFFAHGNRDFLVGEGLARELDFQLLGTETVIDLYGTAVLLMHGDTLCTDDTAYQQMRKMLHDPSWQQTFLKLPLAVRHAQAQALRGQSREATRQKAADITDVNQGAVEEAMQRHGVQMLIHGHTHRPRIHEFVLDGKPARRIVLQDWNGTGGALRCTSEGMWLESLD